MYLRVQDIIISLGSSLLGFTFQKAITSWPCFLPYNKFGSWSSCFYILWVWVPYFLHKLRDDPLDHGFAINGLGMLTFILSKLFFGYWSDFYGVERLIQLGSFLMVIYSPFGFYILSVGHYWACVAAIMGFAVFFGLYGAPITAWMVKLFPNTESKMSSVGIAYNFGLAILGEYSETSKMPCSRMKADL